MIVPKYDGGEGFICGKHNQRQEPLRVESGHDPEPTPCEERGGEAVCSSQEAQRYKESGQLKWLDYAGKRNLSYLS